MDWSAASRSLAATAGVAVAGRLFDSTESLSMLGGEALTGSRFFDTTLEAESIGCLLENSAEHQPAAIAGGSASVAQPPPRPRANSTILGARSPGVRSSAQSVERRTTPKGNSAFVNAHGQVTAEGGGASPSSRRTSERGPSHVQAQAAIAWCDRTPPVWRASQAAAAGPRRRGSPSPPHTNGGATPSGPGGTPRQAGVSRLPQSQPSFEMGRGDVAVCVRLRPGPPEDVCLVPTAEFTGGVRLKQGMGGPGGRFEAADSVYQYDHVFGSDTPQEQVYDVAVAPICGAVIQGYNGAVIAYGQTGSGKTHTMVGNPRNKGMAARAISALFTAMEKSECWTIEVSVLEIYNERVRDLLAPGTGTAHVEIHEVRTTDRPGGAAATCFRCPDATNRRAANPEEAMACLMEGMRRRETHRTDMNHGSSRSHLILSLTATQSDPEMGATLRGRLHLVDLAGSERLKRSMGSDVGSSIRNTSRGPGGVLRTPRDQRREAGEINKSLSQLALVIQRLTNASNSTLQMVPYRDSMLTRLLAESFGGSSKTCLIITCSTQIVDREESRCSLEFGKRAKLVKNNAEINLEVAYEPSPVMQALVAKEIAELTREKDDLRREKEEWARKGTALAAQVVAREEQLRVSEANFAEAVAEARATREQHTAEMQQSGQDTVDLQKIWIAAETQAFEAQEDWEREHYSLKQELSKACDQVTAEFRQKEKALLRMEAECQRTAEAQMELRSLQVQQDELCRESRMEKQQLRVQLDRCREEWMEQMQQGRKYHDEFLEQKQQNELIEHEKAALRSELMEERALQQLQRKEAEIDCSNLAVSASPDIEEVAQAKMLIDQELADSEAQLEETRERRQNSLASKRITAAAYEQATQNRLMSIYNQALEQDSKWNQRLAGSYVKPQLDGNGSICTSSAGHLPMTLSTCASSSGLPVALSSCGSSSAIAVALSTCASSAVLTPIARESQKTVLEPQWSSSRSTCESSSGPVPGVHEPIKVTQETCTPTLLAEPQWCTSKRWEKVESAQATPPSSPPATKLLMWSSPRGFQDNDTIAGTVEHRSESALPVAEVVSSQRMR